MYMTKLEPISREQAREYAIRECQKNIEKYGASAISVMCPMPGKNSWTWQEELDAVLYDTKLENRDDNMIDNFIQFDKFIIEHKGRHAKFE